MKKIFSLVTLLIVTHVLHAGINDDKKRSEEIRQQMWQSGDKDFSVRSIPDKWKNEAAVFIARSHSLSYRKAVMASKLNHNTYHHYRIMLLNSAALEKYSQFTILGSGVYGNERLESFAGFKIIKPDGREIEISTEDAVMEKRQLNDNSAEVYKLAIPNLEIGDILDYYLAEEQVISIYSKYYSFDPVIFQLHGDYPIMKQKISFDVLRRCFINLNTLNGAPSFKLTEDARNDKNHYYLEDGDRESVKDIRWLMPYRELPTVKFKISYASSAAASVIPGFIGRSGEIKSAVSAGEVKELVSYLFDPKRQHYEWAGKLMALNGHMKKYHKKLKDKDKLAREAYYALRNISRIRYAEKSTLKNEESDPEESMFPAIAALSAFYREKKIDHEVLIGIPRHISSLDDLIFENELTFMIKVKGTKPFYIGKFSNHSIAGEIDDDLQGETVYSANGSAKPGSWKLTKVEMPVVSHQENTSETHCQIKVTNLSEGTLQAAITKSIQGSGRSYYQNSLMDIYSFRAEEQDRFHMDKDFESSAKVDARKYVKLRESYLSGREDVLSGALKKTVENDYAFTVESATGLKIHQTGRFDDKAAFKFSYEATMKDAIKKAGPNYLFDIGKLIEEQVQIAQEEKDRKYNIYMPFARSFKHNIEFEIPEGYTVQGAEKLNSRVESAAGGFTSSARIEGSKLIVETSKYYIGNYLKKEQWADVVAFLQAAYDFSQKQVLLKKG